MQNNMFDFNAPEQNDTIGAKPSVRSFNFDEGVDVQPTQSTTNKVVTAVKSTPNDYLKSVADTYANIPSEIVSNVERGAQSLQQGNVGGLIYSGILSAGDTAGAIFAPITSAVGQILEKTGIQKGIEKTAQVLVDKSGITDLPSVQKFAMENPNAESDFVSLSNLLLAMGGKQEINPTKMASEIKALPKTIRAEVTDFVATKVPEIKTKIAQIPQNIGLKKTDVQKRDILGQEVRKTAEGYAKASGVLSDAEKFGSRPIAVFQAYGEKALPMQLEGGKVTKNAIAEPVDFLKSKIKELSEIRSEANFFNDTKIKGKDYLKYAIDLAETRGFSQAKKEMIQKDLLRLYNKELKPAFDKNPQGLSIDEIIKIKSEQTAKSKSYNNPNAKFEYDSHGILGKAARDLEEMFTKDQIATSELNKWIQSHYDAIDLLYSLEGKTPHGGRFTRVVNSSVGTGAGLYLGNMAGHPLLGMAAGRVIANQIDNILNNSFISNPLKRMMIRSIEEQNPALVDKIRAYIREQTADIDIATLGDQSLVPKNELTNSNIKQTAKNKNNPSTKPISKSIPQSNKKVKVVKANKK